jgi:hypothetical protein
MAKYDAVWNQIKQAGWAEITVSNEASRRILTGIKLAKTTENVARRRVGLVGWSKLVITRTQLSDRMMKIRLELLYSTDL